MRVQQVLETCLYVDDLEAAEHFYCQVLGLEPLSRVQGRHTFFRCGFGVFLLFNPAATEQPGQKVPAHGARGPGHVAFAASLAEIPWWRQRLQDYEVSIETEVRWPGGGHSLYFRDPAGNSVELTTPQTWGMEATEGAN